MIIQGIHGNGIDGNVLFIISLQINENIVDTIVVSSQIEAPHCAVVATTVKYMRRIGLQFEFVYAVVMTPKSAVSDVVFEESVHSVCATTGVRHCPVQIVEQDETVCSATDDLRGIREGKKSGTKDIPSVFGLEGVNDIVCLGIPQNQLTVVRPRDEH